MTNTFELLVVVPAVWRCCWTYPLWHCTGSFSALLALQISWELFQILWLLDSVGFTSAANGEDVDSLHLTELYNQIQNTFARQSDGGTSITRVKSQDSSPSQMACLVIIHNILLTLYELSSGPYLHIQVQWKIKINISYSQGLTTRYQNEVRLLFGMSKHEKWKKIISNKSVIQRNKVSNTLTDVQLLGIYASGSLSCQELKIGSGWPSVVNT